MNKIKWMLYILKTCLQQMPIMYKKMKHKKIDKLKEVIIHIKYKMD